MAVSDSKFSLVGLGGSKSLWKSSIVVVVVIVAGVVVVVCNARVGNVHAWIKFSSAAPQLHGWAFAGFVVQTPPLYILP